MRSTLVHSPGRRERSLCRARWWGSRACQAAQSALEEGKHKWAVELARELSRLEAYKEQASSILVTGFKALAEQSRSANGRNYYLTQAMEWSGDLNIGKQNVDAAPPQLIDSLPIEMFMKAMAVNLKPEHIETASKKLAVEFEDLQSTYLIELRHGIADIQQVKESDASLRIKTTSSAWKNLLAGRKNLAELLLTGEISLSGDKVELAEFLLHFEPT